MKPWVIAVAAFILVQASLQAFLYSLAANPAASPPAADASPTPVPLFNAQTKLDPDNIIDTPTALITRIGDRVRDRHAREWMFHAYDHYLALYWENRTVSIEIIDRVAKGGKTITFNMTSLFPLNHPNLRCFFEGKGTVAQYSDNMISKQIDPLHYTLTIEYNTNTREPIKIGDRIEFEFSPFLQPPVEGRTNYYGTATLYVVGHGGTVPWEWHDSIADAHQQRGATLDSYPMPEAALTGGAMTLPQQYSDEPKERFKQIATNMAPIDAQPFMLGRRLHHTDFETGAHSEPGNPIFTEQVGKLGPEFVNHSCISCHVNNGRALPPPVGALLLQYAVHVGSDAAGDSHPNLGLMLQSQMTKGHGSPEATIALAGWTTTDGTYGDGTPYTLRKPTYKFTGVTPTYFSPRIAPQLIGMGLLEALDESTIEALAARTKPDGIKGHIQVVTDPVTEEPRLGRFGYKAGTSSIKQQIGSALTNDMGVTNPIYPAEDRGSAQPDFGHEPKLAATDLDHMYHYIATLGIPPRRDLNDPQVSTGEVLFVNADCNQCHVETLHTSKYAPLAEVRNQTIHPYADLLLHDMGPGLADNMAEHHATGAEWRTPPLWGIGLTSGVSGGEAYLHDGRARTLAEAILWHGGEAEKSKEKFRNMSAADRDALIKFLKSL